MNPFDQALLDYHQNGFAEELILHNNYGNPDQMPVEVFFRENLNELERFALSLCSGDILDVGAGVGAHAAILQENGHSVTPLEISKVACQIMKDKGIKRVQHSSIYTYDVAKYDTLLILMNGFGLARSIANAPAFLQKLKILLKPGGKVIVDSSDVAYAFDELPKDHYYGEVRFCYEYKHILGDWLDWLYIDQDKLTNLAEANDWRSQIVFEDDNDQYLTILRPNTYHT